MEIKEITAIRNHLNELEETDVSFLISEKDGANIVNRISAADIIDIINNAKSVLSEAIEDKLLYSISRFFFQRGNSNQTDLIKTIGNLRQAISSKNLTRVELEALEIQNFLYQSGLINLLYRREKPESIDEVKRLRNENQSVRKLLRKRLDETEKLKKELSQTRQSLERFKNDKEAELNGITQNLDTTNEIKKQIEQTKGSVSNSQSELDKVLAHAKTDYDKFSDDLTLLQTDYTSISNNIKEKKETTQKIIDDNQKLNNQLLELQNKSSELKTELEKLLNPAIAQNLRTTFKQRKDWLFASKIVWGLITLIFAGVVAYFAFKFFDNPDFTFELEKVVVSALKLVPFIVLLYFSIRQYTKDRSLEEEYAFRESIATSLMSFAEQIKSEPNKKDDLIKETVTQLYQSPTQLHKNTKQKSPKSDSSVEKLIELIKEIKGITKFD